MNSAFESWISKKPIDFASKYWHLILPNQTSKPYGVHWSAMLFCCCQPNQSRSLEITRENMFHLAHVQLTAIYFAHIIYNIIIHNHLQLLCKNRNLTPLNIWPKNAELQNWSSDIFRYYTLIHAFRLLSLYNTRYCIHQTRLYLLVSSR